METVCVRSRVSRSVRFKRSRVKMEAREGDPRVTSKLAHPQTSQRSFLVVTCVGKTVRQDEVMEKYGTFCYFILLLFIRLCSMEHGACYTACNISTKN